MANDWSGGVVPGPNDNVTIAAGKTVTISGTVESINSLTLAGTLDIEGDFTSGSTGLSVAATSSISGTLTMEGGTLEGAGNITVSGTFNFRDGDLTGTGTLNIASGGTCVLDDVFSQSKPTYQGRTFDKPLSNSGTITYTSTRSASVTANGAITNQSGGTINIDTAAGISAATGSSPATLVNAGALNIAPGSGSTLPFGVPLTNTGTFTVQSGTFADTAAFTNEGTVTVTSTTTLSDNGALYEQIVGTTTVTGTLSSNQTVTLIGGTLSGTGTVSANVSNAATVAPGSSIGILTVSGNYSQTSLGDLSINVAGTSPGSTYSQLAVTGTVTLNGALTLNLTYNSQVGDTYRLIDDQSSSAVSNSFNGLPEGSTFQIGVSSYGITYQGGTGNDVVVTAKSSPDIWTGGATGNWNTPGSWSEGRVPGATDDAVINAGSDVTLSSGTQTARSLTLGGTLDLQSGATLSLSSGSIISGTLLLDGGTLTGAGNISVTGTADWYDGTLTGAGNLTIASTGTLNVADGSITSPVGGTLDRALVNSGTVTWTAGRSTTVTSNGTINNQSGASFTLQNSTGGLAASGSAPTFTNAGTLTVSEGSDTFDMALPLTNTGTITIQSGTLDTTAAIANSGTLTVASTLDTSGAITNSGTLAVSGTLDASGAIANSGTTTISGSLAATAAFSNTATVTVSSLATLSVTGALYQQTAGTTTVNGTLSSDQTVTLTGGRLAGTGTVSANLSNGGTVTPGSSSSPGILTISGNYAQVSSGTLSEVLAGTVAGYNGYSQLVATGSVTLGGTLSVAVTYTPSVRDSYQIIDPQSGSAIMGAFGQLAEGGVLVSGGYAFSNTYRGGAGNDQVLTFLYDVVTWSGADTGDTGDWEDAKDWSTQSVPGANANVVIGAGDTVTISAGESVSINSLNLQGGLIMGDTGDDTPPSLTIEAASTVSGTLTMYHSTLGGPGNITVNGAGSTLNWYDGTFTGSGQLIIGSSGMLTVAKGSLPGKYFYTRGLDRALVNSGTVVLDDGNGFVTTTNGVITNEAGGAFDLESNGGLSGSGSFDNIGTITAAPGSGAPVSLGVPLTNTGTLSVRSGTLDTTAAVTNQGTLTVAATLAATGSITNDGTVSIASSSTLSDTGATYQQDLGGTTTVIGTLSSNEPIDLNSGTLAGTGTVSGNVTNAADVSPGNAAGTLPGVLTISGNYTQTSSGTLSVDVAGTTPGTGGYSQLSVTGSVALAGYLQPTLNYPPQPGDTYRLIAEQSTSSLSGWFAGLPQNALAVIGIYGFEADYQTGSGMSLTTTPFQVVTWMGGASGDWNVAGNWQGGQVPNSNDEVIIGAGSTVTLSGGSPSIDFLSLSGSLNLASGASLALATASSVSGTLNLSGGTLENDGSLAVTGTLDWYDGTIMGLGTTTVSGGTLNIADGSITNPVGRILEQPLDNAGTVNWTTSRITTASGSIDNESGGTIDIVDSTAGFAVTGTPAPAFTNAGTFTFADGTNTFDFGDPTNTGTLNVESGTLAFTAAFTNEGVVTIASGATLSVTGADYEQTSGSTTVDGTLSSDESIDVANGTLTGSGIVQGDLSNSGTLAPGNPLQTLTVTGNYAQSASGVLSVDLAGTVAGNSYSQLVVGGSVSLNGTLVVSLNYLPTAGDSYQIIDQQSSAPVNGTFAGLAEGGVVLAGIKAFTISYLAGPGNDVGLTSNLNDVVQWIGTATEHDWNTPGAWTGGNVPSANDNVVIGAGNTVTISSGNYAINNISLSGTLNIDGDDNQDSNPSLSIASGSLVTGSLTLKGGTLEGSGNVTVFGSGSALDWYDGMISGTGQLIVTGSGTVNVDSGVSRANRSLDRSLINSGTVVLDDRAGVSATANGLITNQVGGTFDFEGTGALAGASSTFTNQGSIIAALASGTTGALSVPLAGSGTISVESGTFQVTGGGGTSGSTTIAAGATLDFGTNTFSFTNGATVGGTGTFAVSSGTVSVPASGTTLGVGLVDVTGGTANFGSGYTATTTTISGGAANYDAATTVAGLTLSGGTLAGSGNATLSGTATWTGGVIAAASTTIASEATLDLDSESLTLAGPLTNDGTVNAAGDVMLAAQAQQPNSPTPARSWRRRKRPHRFSALSRSRRTSRFLSRSSIPASLRSRHPAP